MNRNGREQSIQLTVIRFRTKGFEHPGLEYRDGAAPVTVLGFQESEAGGGA